MKQKDKSQLIYFATEERVAEQLSTMLNNYANMLRQQQAEIEALKSLFRQLKNEPNLPDAWRKLGEMLDE